MSLIFNKETYLSDKYIEQNNENGEAIDDIAQPASAVVKNKSQQANGVNGELRSSIKEIILDHNGIVQKVNDLFFIKSTVELSIHIQNNQKLKNGEYIWDLQGFIYNNSDVECLYAYKNKTQIILYTISLEYVNPGDFLFHESDIVSLGGNDSIISAFNDEGNELKTKPSEENIASSEGFKKY